MKKKTGFSSCAVRCSAVLAAVLVMTGLLLLSQAAAQPFSLEGDVADEVPGAAGEPASDSTDSAANQEYVTSDDPLPELILDSDIDDTPLAPLSFPADIESLTPMLQSLVQDGDFLRILESESFRGLIDMEELHKRMKDGSIDGLTAGGDLESLFNPQAMESLLGNEDFHKLISTPQFQHLINSFGSMDLTQEIDLDEVRNGELGSYLDSVLGEGGDIDPTLLDDIIERFGQMEELLEE